MASSFARFPPPPAARAPALTERERAQPCGRCLRELTRAPRPRARAPLRPRVRAPVRLAPAADRPRPAGRAPRDACARAARPGPPAAELQGFQHACMRSPPPPGCIRPSSCDTTRYDAIVTIAAPAPAARGRPSKGVRGSPPWPEPCRVFFHSGRPGFETPHPALHIAIQAKMIGPHWRRGAARWAAVLGTPVAARARAARAPRRGRGSLVGTRLLPYCWCARTACVPAALNVSDGGGRVSSL